MTLQNALEIFSSYSDKLWGLGAASGIIYHDGATAAPKKSGVARAKMLSVLSEQSYTLSVSPEFLEALTVIDQNKAEVEPKIARGAFLYLKEAREMQKIPMNEYVEFARHISASSDAWREAKEKSDFALFAPYLQQTVETLRKFAGYTSPDKDPYDVCLDKYESGLTIEECDKFFGSVKPALIELIKKVCAAEQPDTSFMEEYFPIDKQKALAQYINDVMGIDPERFTVAETEHPYTTNASKYDVRVATHYYEKDFGSALFSNIHENGHALYELGIGDEYDFSVLGSGVSMGIHESQSRFYENIIGRSLPFAEFLLKKLKEIQPSQFRNVDAVALWKALAESKPALIRTESDELTYTMHIIIRYELEKALIHGNLSVADLPKEWNRLYKEYLGVDVPDDKRGVLQDCHWSDGSIGYFPSYALGSAYGAQFLCKMKETVDVDKHISEGDFAPVNAWLGENVWRHGCMYEPGILFQNACGEKFDSKYFIEYLTEKYTKLYNL